TAGDWYGLSVSHSTALAMNVDEHMLGRHGVAIAPPFTPTAALPKCQDLVAQLGDRFLFKYVRKGDHLRFATPHVVGHFDGEHWVTPTVICRPELVATLALPTHLEPPRFVLVLDPAKLDARGPRRVDWGTGGIEYVL